MKLLFQNLPIPEGSKIHYYVEDLPHFVVPWHYHAAIEIMYITSGTGTRFVGDSIERYEEGDVCMIGPNLPHEWKNDEKYFNREANLRASCICLFIREEIFSKELLDLSEMESIKKLLKDSRRGIKFNGLDRERIAEEISSHVNDTGVEKILNVLKILSSMASSSQYELLSSTETTEDSSIESKIFKKIYQYLIANLANQIRISDMCELTHMSTASFCRFFKKRTGKTFNLYLNEMRVNYAKKLILEGKTSLSQICTYCGLGSKTNFITAFKKSTGYTPSEFKRTNTPTLTRAQGKR